MGCGIVITSGDSAGSWEAARRKAEDPLMTVNGNPLRRDFDPHACMVDKHMDELIDDARRWNNQRSGMAYRAIRGMVYQGGE